MEKTAIRFLRRSRPFGANVAGYEPGDVAGFEETMAARLVLEGEAVYSSPVDKQSGGRSQAQRGGSPVTKVAAAPRARVGGRFVKAGPANG